ncbi:hypothetical protein [Neorhizobium galegae]|uniref:hypothetical protein n=1 Tax=Neorhizobium galegae TaxID=399 RepID=UPI0006219E75|nr:hypothetical protein [Neorhizobium galegae]CDZ51733.1 Hypothetical protein NGAL_HAMBI2427_42960 [Neorhizobium galegae bv. orientalis]
MTTIGSTSHGTNSAYAGAFGPGTADNATARAAQTGETNIPGSTNAPVNISGSAAASQLMEGLGTGDIDTFLYDQTGKLAEPAKELQGPAGPGSRFANVHEENAFVRSATPEELAEVYAPENVESILSAREIRKEGEEWARQSVNALRRQDPGFVANSFKGQAHDIIGKVEENLKLLNTFQQMLAAPESQNPADHTRLGSFVERFLGSIMDLSEGLQGIVSVSGNLIRQQDDGTYVLSDFALSYDGVLFLKHQE